MTPGEVARATGVSTDTLRHYEKKGLLAPPARSASGYRRYSTDTVARVRLIQRALVIGFSLNDLARVLRERDGGGAPCRSVRALVTERLADLDARVEALVALRGELRKIVEEWDAQLAGTPAGRRAHLLEGLGERPAIERARGLKTPRLRRRP
jgi:DNA-binding transcriptional MerR regulator